MTPGALGSDTGGSVRQPAALTGIVGIKPTWGRVSRYGLFAFASSLDQVGVFARDVRGAARLLEVIAGHDPRDATSARAAVPALGLDDAPEEGHWRIGVPEALLQEGVEPGVLDRFRRAIDAMTRRGATVVPVDLGVARHAIAAYYVLATAEASSNLARYDGVRFGLRVHDGVSPLGSLYDATRGRGFGAEVKRRILLGTFVLSSGFYEAYYVRAQRARTLVLRAYERGFANVDVIATPTSPTVAFRLGSRTEDPLSMYLADAFTLPPSLAGLPAISVPCGLATAPEGSAPLPVGLQLVAPAFEERRLARAARALERALADEGGET
jgi:aspartyl-tRNA(Asn)/glutamyl-tRNA(Gln) amidotransferase subunit A